MVYLLKIVLFHSYVSLPEGIIIFWCNFGYTPCSNPNPLFIGSRLLNHIKPPFFKSPFLLVKFPHPFFWGGSAPPFLASLLKTGGPAVADPRHWSGSLPSAANMTSRKSWLVADYHGGSPSHHRLPSGHRLQFASLRTGTSPSFSLLIQSMENPSWS